MNDDIICCWRDVSSRCRDDRSTPLQLMASHKQELANLSERLDHDKQRQTLALRDKLARSRKHKLNTLRRKQEGEMTREAMIQQRELDEIRGKQVLPSI